jgi:hypothetical protein
MCEFTVVGSCLLFHLEVRLLLSKKTRKTYPLTFDFSSSQIPGGWGGRGGGEVLTLVGRNFVFVILFDQKFLDNY